MKVINIVSGKGGTGKTLLTAVLAETLGNAGSNVLVIDLDVFVRGLTSLLYYHKNEKIKLCEPWEMSVSEFFINKGIPSLFENRKKKFAISRYRSFDVIPSVSRVDELLQFSDLMPDTKKEALDYIQGLLRAIKNEKSYDFIFFDSRAGYDELISASHQCSDITICVEEEDNISRITTDNLINQMQNDTNNPIFRLINKTTSDKEYTASSVTHIGNIPFDMDIMRTFGQNNFWDDLKSTIYLDAIIKSWNNLSNKMDLSCSIESKRQSPFRNRSIEKKLQFYSLKDRVMIIYGILIGFMGVLYPLFQNGLFNELLNNRELLLRIMSSFVGIFGFALTFLIILKNRKK
ncbi:ParA family protein [Providencia stuartii]|uniref:ParA family protein n=1 Tax=Providencia stuartii TaxID=588 RepID=UPI0013D5EC09|nr:AAA family ATPase [Providencia stuartii]